VMSVTKTIQNITDDDDDHSSDSSFNDDDDDDEDDEDDDDDDDDDDVNEDADDDCVHNDVGDDETPKKPCVSHNTRSKQPIDQTQIIRVTTRSNGVQLNSTEILKIIENSLKTKILEKNNTNSTTPSHHLTRSNIRKRKRAAVPNIILPSPPFVPKNLDELIDLAKISKNKCFKDCQRLPVLLPALLQLQNLIGLKKIKQQIYDVIIHRLQKRYLSLPEIGHVIIYGAPGVGKTTLLSIIAKIFSAIGDLQTEKVVHGTASTMIAGYLGQTTKKTDDLIKSAFGGVLALDEASSLSSGGKESSDSYSKQCLDALNRALTEHASDFICILCGYKDEIEANILASNPGLRRRFSIIFDVDGYDSNELKQIALVKISNKKICFAEKTSLPSIDLKYFPNYAGDIELFVDKIVCAHAKQVFGKTEKNILNQKSIDEGYAMYKLQHNAKNLSDLDNTSNTMYM
jgi:SpoVK/Ycf46/Vps4 family AAA+-type ATPase